MLDEPLFGVAPETFQAVDVNPAPGETFAMVDFEMPVTRAHEGIIASEFIRVNNRSTFHGADRQIHQGFSRNILDDLDLDSAVALQEAKDGDLAPSAPSSWAPSSSAEIGLIQLDFSLELMEILGLSEDRQSQKMRGLEGRGITHPHFTGNSQARDLQLKEFHDPEPLFGPEIELADPAAREVPKGVPADRAAVSFCLQAVDFSALTTDAKSCTLFPTPFDKEQPGLILSPDKEFKAFEFHDTSLILVSNY